MIEDLKFDLKESPLNAIAKAKSKTFETANDNLSGLLMEKYISKDGESRSHVGFDSDKGKELIKRIIDMFGFDLVKSSYSHIPAIGHEEKTDVVTVIVGRDFIKQLEGRIPLGMIFTNLKFDLANKQVYLKTYKLMQAFEFNSHPILPVGSRIIAWADYSDFPDYDYPEQLNNEIDLFFYNENLDVVNDFFDVSFLPAKHKNAFSIRYKLDTQEIIKVKNYTYNEKSTYSEWDSFNFKAELMPNNEQLMMDTMYLHAQGLDPNNIKENNNGILQHN